MDKAKLNESIRQFIMKWMKSDKGQIEDKDDRSFWIDLFQKVLGVQNATDILDFQKRVTVNESLMKIDVYIKDTKILIEQKSKKKKLDQKIQQGDGALLTPFEQARRYNNHLISDEQVDWIITSNFNEIWIYNMHQDDKERKVIKIKLEELQTRYKLLSFLVKKDIEELTEEEEVSKEAGEIIGEIYDAFLKEYGENPTNQELHELNKLCVRLVFCLYAEDAGLFNDKAFYNYLSRYNTQNMNMGLRELFKVLNTPDDGRDKFLDKELNEFPYVNGELFSEEISIPPITENIRKMLLENASKEFDWSRISPTIFGALFESTLNPETRREHGMVYTSVKDIHKVIEPLFLSDLKKEFANILLKNKSPKTRGDKLRNFQDKLAGLKIIDPACGSGNFLTETYLSLRKLENKVLCEIVKTEKKGMSGQVSYEFANPIKVSISQFYGIEINDFAVTVAKTAMWIAENQMMEETKEMIVGGHYEFLPLTTNATIVCANALQIDWNDIISKNDCDYIIGNPPFVGYNNRKPEQKKDMADVFETNDKGVKLDYVTAWYYKASQYMLSTSIKSAFVSTSSIVQGEQVSLLWEYLRKNNVNILFAWKPFEWKNGANNQVKVWVVIIGFVSGIDKTKKRLFYDDHFEMANNINGYLENAPNIIIKERTNPICDVPKIVKGSSPVGGDLLINTEEEYQEIMKDEIAKKYVRKFIGAQEYLKNKKRWCIWMPEYSPQDVIKSKVLQNRFAAVKEDRLSSKKEATRKKAEEPNRFMEVRQPKNNYIVAPRHTTANRGHMIFGFVDKNIICGDANSMIPNGTLYHFGVLSSNIHTLWAKIVSGKLGKAVRYSNTIVYNNFPWPTPTTEQIKEIERTAKQILDIRKKYSDCSLEVLYSPKIDANDLNEAHRQNDIAVMKAYGFDVRNTSAEDCVIKLMEMYYELVKE